MDRKRKQSMTVFLKILGTNESEIREVFNDLPVLIETLEEDTVHTQEEALADLYHKLRPGGPSVAETGHALLNNFHFNTKRYGTAKVGRLRLNKRFGLDPANELRQPSISNIMAVPRYLLALHTGYKEVVCSENGTEVEIETDNIDYFGNRRIHAVGKLI